MIRQRRLVAVLVACAFGGVAAATLHAQAQTERLRWTVRTAEVRVACPLTIGGSFDAKTKQLNGSLARPTSAGESLAGELIVDLASLDTGIELRDRHLRDTYLEVGKGPEFSRAVLREVRLVGLDSAAPSGKGRFGARLALHGVERPIEGQAELKRTGATVRVKASFPVVLQDFGIATPRYLGVGVKDEVTVQVSLDLSEEKTE